MCQGFLNNYVLNVPFRYNGNSYDARVDHYFSEQTKIFAKDEYVALPGGAGRRARHRWSAMAPRPRTTPITGSL